MLQTVPTHGGPKERIIPFLKWAGGKRWLIEQHPGLIPRDFAKYYEPFLGSGSVFFHVAPETSVLSDTNLELISCYKAIKSFPERIGELLAYHHERHNKEYYYLMRSAVFSSREERAAQFVYLNRTCFNGIYRVNLRGQFNVPVGSKQNVVLETDNFDQLAKRLAGAELLVCDFEQVIDRAKERDFVYIDPPYTVKHNNNGFVKYNEKIFSWSDQIRLRDSVVAASRRGAKILVSNAAHGSIIELYAGIGKTYKLSRASVLSGKSSGRGRYDEILVVINA